MKHPQYSGSQRLLNDVALLRVSTDMETSAISTLGAAKDSEYQGDYIIAGFGALSESGGFPTALQIAAVPPVTNGACLASAIGTYLEPGMMCAGMFFPPPLSPPPPRSPPPLPVPVVFREPDDTEVTGSDTGSIEIEFASGTYDSSTVLSPVLPPSTPPPWPTSPFPLPPPFPPPAQPHPPPPPSPPPPFPPPCLYRNHYYYYYSPEYADCPWRKWRYYDGFFWSFVFLFCVVLPFSIWCAYEPERTSQGYVRQGEFGCGRV